MPSFNQVRGNANQLERAQPVLYARAWHVEHLSTGPELLLPMSLMTCKKRSKTAPTRTSLRAAVPGLKLGSCPVTTVDRANNLRARHPHPTLRFGTGPKAKTSTQRAVKLKAQAHNLRTPRMFQTGHGSVTLWKFPGTSPREMINETATIPYSTR
jgi:hypothetical protein